MADRVRKVNYCYVKLPTRAGNGSKVLETLKDAGITMQAFSGFPAGGGKAQLDFVVENVPAVRRALAKEGWSVSAAKKGLLIQGQDRPGAAQRHLKKLLMLTTDVMITELKDEEEPVVGAIA